MSGNKGTSSKSMKRVGKSMGASKAVGVSVVCRGRLNGPDELQRLHGGIVLRVFVPRTCDGYSADVVARVIRVSLAEAGKQNLKVSLVVLPAGIGLIRDAAFPIMEPRRPDEAEVTKCVHAWADSVSKKLGDHPPVVFGLDGYTDEEKLGIQLAVRIEDGKVPAVTWKSLPTSAERSSLVTLWGPPNTTPSAGALKKNAPVASVGGEPALFMVCHDATAFAGRAKKQANDDTWSGVMHDQYDALAASEEIKLGINLIHQLPRGSGGRMMTSPVFQSGHQGLQKRMHVIAVAGLAHKCRNAAFERLHRLLACDYKHLDLRVDVTPT